MMHDLELIRAYALQHVGIPYHYGGGSPMEGEDCSHFVCEILQAFGILPHGNYLTSSDLASHFISAKTELFDLGDLAFFGTDQANVDHVGFCLNESCMINAAGGVATTTSIFEAIKRQAYIKIRPIHYRKDFLFAVRPPWGT